jgi:hypothetical protein
LRSSCPLSSCFWFAALICALVFTSSPDLVLRVEFVFGTIWFPMSSSFFRLTLVLISIHFSRVALISSNGPAVQFLTRDFVLRFTNAHQAHSLLVGRDRAPVCQFFVCPRTSVSAWLHFSSVRRSGFDPPSKRSAPDRISCSRSLLFSVSVRTRAVVRAARADSVDTKVSAARGQFFCL